MATPPGTGDSVTPPLSSPRPDCQTDTMAVAAIVSGNYSQPF